MNEQVVDTSSNLVQDNAQANLSDAEKYEAYRVERSGKQVEKPAPVEEPKPQVAQDAETEDEGKAAEPEPAKEKSTGWKRVKEERDRLRAENEDLKARLNAKEPKETKPAPELQAGEPDLADYDNVPAWKRDHDKWTKQKDAAEKAEADRQNAHQKRMATAKKAHGEQFDKAMADLDGIQAKGDALDAILDSEHSAEILFHLGSDAEEAERFHEMPEREQIKYIGRIEEKLASAAAPQTDNKPTPKTPKAPPKPITPLSGGRLVGSPANDWQSSEDYEIYRAGRKRAAQANQ